MKIDKDLLEKATTLAVERGLAEGVDQENKEPDVAATDARNYQ